MFGIKEEPCGDRHSVDVNLENAFGNLRWVCRNKEDPFGKRHRVCGN